MQLSPKEYINIKNNIYNPPNPGPPNLKNIISTTNKLDFQNQVVTDTLISQLLSVTSELWRYLAFRSALVSHIQHTFI